MPAITVVLVGIALFVAAGPAHATQPCPQTKCYTLAVVGPLGGQPHGFLGEYVDLHAYCLSVIQPYSDYVDVESWSANVADYAWIESGIRIGVVQNGYYTQPFFFWAAGRIGGQYYQHNDPYDSVSNSGNYRQSVRYATPTNFNVRAGPYQGSSPGWPSGYLWTELQTGSELSNNSVTNAGTVHGESSNMHFYDENDSEYYGWLYNSNSTNYYSDPTSWGYIVPVNPNKDYEYGTTTYSC